jgi:hypothetical protein
MTQLSLGIGQEVLGWCLTMKMGSKEMPPWCTRQVRLN